MKLKYKLYLNKQGLYLNKYKPYFNKQGLYFIFFYMAYHILQAGFE